ncbi:MAG: response regulator [Dehalococcoidia bacterium]
MAETTAACVAIINTSEEVVELIRMVLEEEGFAHVAEAVLTFKRGERDVASFLATHDARVVIWDIALPYAENWAFFSQLQRDAVFRGRGVVVTTTNKRALELFVGPTPTVELVGKPFDLGELVQAVRRALATAAPPGDGGLAA